MLVLLIVGVAICFCCTRTVTVSDAKLDEDIGNVQKMWRRLSELTTTQMLDASSGRFPNLDHLANPVTRMLDETSGRARAPSCSVCDGSPLAFPYYRCVRPECQHFLCDACERRLDGEQECHRLIKIRATTRDIV